MLNSVESHLVSNPFEVQGPLNTSSLGEWSRVSSSKKVGLVEKEDSAMREELSKERGSREEGLEEDVPFPKKKGRADFSQGLTRSSTRSMHEVLNVIKGELIGF